MENIDTLFKNLDSPEADQRLGRAIRAMLRRDLKENFRKELETLQQTEKQPTPVLQINRWLGPIAASLLLVGISLFLFKPGNDFDSQMASYVTESPMSHPGMLKGNEDKTRETAITAYENQEWNKAIESFSSITEPAANDAFYQALSNFYKKDYRQALIEFEMLPSGNYAQEVNWFLALSYLKTSNFSKAKATLQKIGATDWKYKEAQSLLNSKKLKNIR